MKKSKVKEFDVAATEVEGAVEQVDDLIAESPEELERHRKTPQPFEAAIESGAAAAVEGSSGGWSARAPHSHPHHAHAPHSRSKSQFSFSMLNSDAPFAGQTRSLYFGGLGEGCTIRDICDSVRGERGLESVRLLPAKSCAFVDFISRVGAERFVSRCRRFRSGGSLGGNASTSNRPTSNPSLPSANPLLIGSVECKLGWAKEKPLTASVAKAIENGATRNVYLSLLSGSNGDEDFLHDPLMLKCQAFVLDLASEASNAAWTVEGFFKSAREISDLASPFVSFLHGIFDEFGPVDMVKVVPMRRIAFIHMASVADAMRAVAELSTRPEFRGKRLAFGRDRCGERIDGAGSSLDEGGGALGAPPATAHNPPQPEPGQASHPFSACRTIYLGGCNSPETTIEDICDLIHTGQLQSVRLNPEKRCAFVTFIKPEAAELFLARALQFGLLLRGYPVKPAFAKERDGSIGAQGSAAASNATHTTPTAANPLPAAIAAALRKGYTRNLFLGNIDPNILTESLLRQELARFGPLDRVQILRDRQLAFVHFANLLDAGGAFEQTKNEAAFKGCRVGFGKDRCEGAGGSLPTGPNTGFPMMMYHNPKMAMYPPPPYPPAAYAHLQQPYHPAYYDPSVIFYPPPPPPHPPTPHEIVISASTSTSSLASNDPRDVETP